MAAAALAVVYPIAYALWLIAFEPRPDAATLGLLILLADMPFAIACSIWLLLKVSNPTAIALVDRFLAFETRHRVIGRLVIVAVALAVIASGAAALVTVGLLRTV